MSRKEDIIETAAVKEPTFDHHLATLIHMLDEKQIIELYREVEQR